MKNQTITAAKIAEIHEGIERDQRLADAVESDILRKHYRASISAKWETLEIILGTETHWETIQTVRKIAQQYREAA